MAALRDSCVLEHFARWALHIQLRGAARGVLKELVERAVLQSSLALAQADFLAVKLHDRSAAHVLHEALSGPCVRHLALSLGLTALCAADGGPSHGLPPDLMLHLPIRGRHGGNLRGTHGRQRLCNTVSHCMLRALKYSTAAQAAPLRDWRSQVELPRRIGLLAVAAARAWAAGEVAEAAAGPTPPQELVLDATDIMDVALRALEHMRRLVCDPRPALAEADAPGALAEAEAAWWRLAVEVATHCARWGASMEVEQLADLLSLTWRPLPAGHMPTGVPPPVTPRVVTAALAGGLLPLWERLLRHAGRDPYCREAALLTCMLGRATDGEGLCDLLACCELQQGAALVATWGKLLRTLVVPQLLSRVGEGGDAGAETQQTTLTCNLAGFALQLLVSGRKQVASAAPAANATAPQLQLARLLSYAVCDWLPPLARLAREGLPALHRYMLTGRAYLLKGAAVERVLDSALALVRWLPALVEWGSKPEAAAGAAASADPVVAGGAAAAQPAAEAAASGWRQLLLWEIGAVPLLGTACQVLLRRLTPGKGQMGPEDWRPLITSCCLVTAAYPGEVRQAVLAAAAEAGASAGSGSGGGRGVGPGGGRRRGGRGASGRGGEPGPSRAATPLPPGWSPQLLQLMAVELRSGRGDGWEALAAAASALARQAAQWGAGGGEDGTELGRAVVALGPQPADAAARPLVSSPSEARAMLRTCANPACDNLAGDSEAEVPLRACGRCGGAWYCRRECLVAHWRSGHKEACAGPGAMAAVGAAGTGESMPAPSAR
ncbi:hypothetical protein TSOC_006952 [Tetrabaena socialis]|uniref:phytol kinase n=1 Tax=Tetrabaena socialis TaxID=47790 RepID=A0A2J8A2B2_9CHLO|nr:hypothetical protein TSOC_006952 [Tetrabaena socialis]|eukprot:PNH06653.1 hypothetical protein TSOC_006952 [Tetrabaena socialis]